MRGGYGTSNHGTLADRAGVPSGPHASQVPGSMSKLDSFSQSASDTESARSKGHRSFERAAGTGGASPRIPGQPRPPADVNGCLQCAHYSRRVFRTNRAASTCSSRSRRTQNRPPFSVAGSVPR